MKLLKYIYEVSCHPPTHNWALRSCGSMACRAAQIIDQILRSAKAQYSPGPPKIAILNFVVESQKHVSKSTIYLIMKQTNALLEI